MQKKSTSKKYIPQIGLTGNIASGKSQVAKILQNDYDAAVIDADNLARQATQDARVLAEISERLSPSLVKAGELDRAATAAYVFGNEEARAILNSIIHPWVATKREQHMLQLQEQANPPSIVVHDIPLLYEAGLGEKFAAVIVVVAPLELRIARAIKYRGMAADDVRARDKSQMPQEAKVTLANFVIDNSGTLEDLHRQVADVWRQLAQL